MGSTTGIQWAHATWNPVRGCTKISEGCAHCYAADFSLRNPATLGSWEPGAPRVIGGPANWREPVKLAKAHIKALAEHAAGRPISEVEGLRARADRAKDPKARAKLLAKAAHIERRTHEGRPLRLFTASLGDIGEDHPQVAAVRDRIWRETLPELDALRLPDGRPALVLLALTKRARVMRDWYDAHGCPDTVWPGVTVENQRRADERIPIMLGLPRLWLSMEPLLEAVDLDPSWCAFCETNEHVRHEEPAQPWCWECDREAGSPGWLGYDGVQWIIVGGESGPHARPMHPEWVRHLRDQAVAAGVPFHFKQWGEWAPAEYYRQDDGTYAVKDGIHCLPVDGVPMSLRVGKHAAGRLLDGREWSEVPDAS